MALGGGSFVAQNKVLPGTYINFISTVNASASLSERGIVTMPLTLDWGVSGEVFEVTVEDFQKKSMKIFGYSYSDDSLKGLCDLFLNASKLYAYRLNGGGVKAANSFATAKYAGTRGNAIKIVIQKNIDNDNNYDVLTYLDTTLVDTQTVAAANALVDNDYVIFKSNATLAVTAATPLTGGTNSTVNGEAYQSYLDKIEAYSYNTMGVVTTETTIKSLFASFCKRIRDEVGMKFQLVLYNYTNPDYMGVISVDNKCIDGAHEETTGSGENAVTTTVYPYEAAGVYWVTGAQGGCAINKSLQNRKYNGEFTFDLEYTQNELIDAINSGKFVLHSVSGEPRVLDDINTMVTTSDTCGEVFKDNQTICVIDQIGNDIAVIFSEKYLGDIPNDEEGRISLWSDIVKHHKELMEIGAIEDFNDEDVIVEQGSGKKSVVIFDAVTVINAMGKLYMTVSVA